MKASAADLPAILPKHTARGARLPRCRVTGMKPSQNIIFLRATSCINSTSKLCGCSDVTMGFRDTHRLIGELTVLPLRRAPTGLAAFPCPFYCRKTKRLRRSKAHRRCVMRISFTSLPRSQRHANGKVCASAENTESARPRLGPYRRTSGNIPTIYRLKAGS